MTIEPLPEFEGVHSAEAFAAGLPGSQSPESHLRLVEAARELPILADKGDHGALSLAAASVLEAFVKHADLERPQVLRLPRFTARLIENGQQRIVDRLVSLVLEADLAEEPCRCRDMADEVASLIDVQLMSEEWDQTDR
jgi:hypothetical protein